MAQKIATICFRITSAYLFYYAIVPLMIPLSNPPDMGTAMIITALIISAFLSVFGVLVWRYASVLPEKLLWLDVQESGKQPIAPLLFRIIGLYLIFAAIPRVVWLLSTIGYSSITATILNFVLPIFRVLIGVLTWRFAKVLATRFARGEEDGKSRPSIIWDESDL